MKCPRCGSPTRIVVQSANQRTRKCEACPYEGKTVETWRGDDGRRGVGRPPVRVIAREDDGPPHSMTAEQAHKEIYGY